MDSTGIFEFKDKNITLDNFIEILHEGNLIRKEILFASAVVGRNLINLNNDEIGKYCSLLNNQKTNLTTMTMEQFSEESEEKRLILHIDYKYETIPRQKEQHKATARQTLSSFFAKNEEHRSISRLKSKKDCDNVFQELANSCIDDNMEYKYCDNMKLLGCQLLQEKVNKYSLIDEDNNDNVADMDGINKSTFYSGQPKSFSPLHIKHGNLPSVNGVFFNICNSGKKKISKLWLIVDKRDKQKLEHCVQNSLNSSCMFRLNHKNVFVTPDFLNKHGISYFYLKQYPGDVVFIDFSVFHQVINISANFAEEINFGTKRWNFEAKFVSTCQCKDRKVVPIHHNDGVVYKITEKKVKKYVCGINGCPAVFRNKVLWGTHQITVHNIERPFSCNICNKNWKRSNEQASHICINEKINRPYCYACKTTFSRKSKHENTEKHRINASIYENEKNEAGPSSAIDNGDHIQAMQPMITGMTIESKNICTKCKKRIPTVDGLKVHEKKCLGVSCDSCDEKFYSRSTMRTHRKKHTMYE